jgi:hypothetical protein
VCVYECVFVGDRKVLLEERMRKWQIALLYNTGFGNIVCLPIILFHNLIDALCHLLLLHSYVTSCRLHRQND